MNFKTLAAFLSASILVCPATQAQSVILTSDQQLHDITDPDRIVDLSVGNEPFRKSFRQVCEWGKSMGSTQLIVAFDEFFRQYRMQVGTERRLTPDMDEYIGEMKKISDFAKGYGLGLFYVKTMAEKHGGSVSVKSEPGKGSTFTVRLNK